LFAFISFLTIDKLSQIADAQALGTINLVANFFDNMTHGTTVVGAFMISTKVGQNN
jgi:hypothetical protein